MAAERSNGASPATGPSPEELTERVQELSARLETAGDPATRALAEELVGAVVDLYGAGLERIVAAVDGLGEGGRDLRERLAADGVVGSLLLIHDLYPVGLEERVLEALETVRPYMESHGGDVELLSLEDGVATIRMQGSCDGCPASSSTLELAIKSALDEAAPDLTALVVEGAAPAPAAIGGHELPVVQMGASANGNGAAPERPEWLEVAGLDAIAEGEVTGREVAGARLAIARVEGGLLAFHDRCPACSSALAGGELSEGVLACPGCERRYFLPRAGRSMDDDGLLLEPVPLLADRTGARVALAR